MKLKFTRVVIAAVLVSVFGSCTSPLTAIINTGDSELMYNEAINLYNNDKFNRSITLFTACQPYLAGGPREDSVAYFVSTAYYKMGDFYTSAQYFNEFRRRYSRSSFLEEVEYMYAMSTYYTTLPAYRDQTMSLGAIISINEYLGRYQESVKREKLEAHVIELTERLHDKEYLNAKVYYTTGQYKAAVVALQNALDTYPESRRREEILYLILDSNYIYAKNSFEHLQRDRFLVMMDAYYNYTAEFPDTKQRKDADKMQEYAKQILAQYNTENEDGSKEEQ